MNNTILNQLEAELTRQNDFFKPTSELLLKIEAAKYFAKYQGMKSTVKQLHSLLKLDIVRMATDRGFKA